MENVVRFEKFRKLSTSHGLSIKYVSNVDGRRGQKLAKIVNG